MKFVTAHQIVRSGIWDLGVPLYNHLVSRYSAKGLDVVPFLDCMLVFYYIIGNTDRHMNNFGIIRDADILEWLCSISLFDNGACMGCDLLTVDIVSGSGMDRKPFSEYWPR